MKKLLIGIGACGLLSALILLAASPFSNVLAQAPADGLVGYWRLDKTVGGKMVNEVTGLADGTLIGSPSLGAGKLGNSRSFKGIDGQHIDIRTATLDNLDQVTVSAWIFPQQWSGTTDTRTIVSKGSRSPRRFMVTADTVTKRIRFSIGDNGKWVGWTTPEESVPLGKWTHVAVSYSFGAAAPVMYINGSAVALTQTGTLTGTPTVDNNGFYIGGMADKTRVFDGRIDEVRLYARTVSATEVAEIYASENPPNIVVIMTDDQDIASLEYMPKVESLIIDRGVSFANSFVNFSLCCPSRATFLTGQAAHNHNIVGNSMPTGGFEKFIPLEDNTLAVWLADKGYDTALIGKYFNGYASTSPTMIPGWSTWMPIGLGRYSNYDLFENGAWKHYYYSDAEYETDVLAGKSKEYIAGTAVGKPFFLFLTPNAPHTPVKPATRHKGMFAATPFPTKPNFNESDVSDKPLFWQQGFPLLTEEQIAEIETRWRNNRETLQSLDELVEDVIAALDAKGVTNNTIIVFTSDNGFAFGEHRKDVGKVVPYEESVRVPLIVRGPGIPVGQIRNQLVYNLDLPASIVEWAHLTPGRILDGHSLLPVIANAQTPWRSGLIIEGQSAPASGAPAVNGYPADYFTAVRTANYKYIEHARSDGSLTPEFYDLATDPYELENKAGDPAYTSVVSTLDAMLEPLKTCVGAECWVTTPEPSL